MEIKIGGQRRDCCDKSKHVMQFGFQHGRCCNTDQHIVQLGGPGNASCISDSDYEKSYKTTKDQFEKVRSDLGKISSEIFDGTMQNCGGNY